jgi:hypothetical protein
MAAPLLVVQDMGGSNNADLAGATARIMRGGSWKKQRIIVILPSADMIAAKVALSHWNLAFPPNNGVVRILALGQEVGEAYSNAISAILADPNLSEWEFVLTLESDNLVPSDAVIRLVQRMEDHPELSVVSALYWTKGPPSADGVGGGVPQIWGDPKDAVLNFRPQPPDPNGGLVECCGTGMGCVLWRLSMFKDAKLRKPWFVTQKKDGVSTQDLYFAADARKFGYRFAVDCSVKSGHLDVSGVFGIQDFAW